MSHYHYALTNPRVNRALGIPPVRPGATLEEALDDGSLPPNLQTRMLSDSLAVTEPADPDRLEEAMRNLLEFTVVGLTERFDESLVLLQTALGIAHRTYRAQPRKRHRTSSPPRACAMNRTAELA